MRDRNIRQKRKKMSTKPTIDNDEANVEKYVQEYTELVMEALEEGATLKDIEGISDEIMEGIYTYAYDFYSQGKLDEAETFFRFLCLYDFYNPDYIMGLAAVKQLQKEYVSAIDLYALAYIYANEDYLPVFYAGQCNLALNEQEKAICCFQLIIEKSKESELVKKATGYLASLQKLSDNDKSKNMGSDKGREGDNNE